MATKKKKSAGRKGKYRKWLTEEGLAKVKNWAIMGATNKEIAEAMKISETTLYEWVEKYSSFAESIKDRDGVADAKVVIAGFKKATGFYYPEEQVHKVKRKFIDRETGKILEEEKLEKITVQKYMPPDTTANIFWRKNRDPKHWADKQEVKLEGTVDINLIIDTLSGDKL